MKYVKLLLIMRTEDPDSGVSRESRQGFVVALHSLSIGRQKSFGDPGNARLDRRAVEADRGAVHEPVAGMYQPPPAWISYRHRRVPRCVAVQRHEVQPSLCIDLGGGQAEYVRIRGRSDDHAGGDFGDVLWAIADSLLL